MKEWLCSKCKEWKPISGFRKDKSRETGLFPWCITCCREHDRIRYAADSRKKEVNQKWKSANREKVNEIERRLNAANPEKARVRKRRWKASHLEDVRTLTRNRRAKRKGNGGRITKKEWQSVLEKYGNKCLYPGCERTDVEMDHVIPIFLGGAHTVDNVQPLCKSHNNGKRIKIIDYRERIIS